MPTTTRWNEINWILDWAIEREVSSGHFYSDWALKVGRPSLKGLLEELAAWEKKHAERLRTIKAARMEPSMNADFSALNALVRRHDSAAAPSSAVVADILKSAMRRDRDMSELYLDLALSSAGSDEARTVLKELSREEEKHYEQLEKELNAL